MHFENHFAIRTVDRGHVRRCMKRGCFADDIGQAKAETALPTLYGNCCQISTFIDQFAVWQGGGLNRMQDLELSVRTMVLQEV